MIKVFSGSDSVNWTPHELVAMDGFQAIPGAARRSHQDTIYTQYPASQLLQESEYRLPGAVVCVIKALLSRFLEVALKE